MKDLERLLAPELARITKLLNRRTDTLLPGEKYVVTIKVVQTEKVSFAFGEQKVTDAQWNAVFSSHRWIPRIEKYLRELRTKGEVNRHEYNSQFDRTTDEFDRWAIGGNDYCVVNRVFRRLFIPVRIKSVNSVATIIRAAS